MKRLIEKTHLLLLPGVATADFDSTFEDHGLTAGSHDTEAGADCSGGTGCNTDYSSTSGSWSGGSNTSETDDSSSGLEVNVGAFTKTVYAINGVVGAYDKPGIAPGDTVTYRLQYALPTADVENLPRPLRHRAGCGREFHRQ